MSDRLTWRVFCEVDGCGFRREGLNDRDTARLEGDTHSRERHPVEVRHFRIQGVAPSRSWAILEDDERGDDRNVDTAWTILAMVHALDAVPFSASSDLDTDVWLHVTSCKEALAALCEKQDVAVPFLHGDPVRLSEPDS